MTKKKMLILFLVAITLFVLSVFCKRPIARIFKEKEHLSYENIRYYTVISGKYSFDVEDAAGIKKITTFLYSLDLVKEKWPEEYLYYNSTVQDEQFYIWIHGEDVTVQFFRNYIVVEHPNGTGGYINTYYYILNSEYNPISGKSKMIDLLEELIDAYAKQ